MTGVIPFPQRDLRRERVMMGRRSQGQRHLFYEFHLDEAVPDDHLVRKVDAVLDLSWVHAELAPHYSRVGRPKPLVPSQVPFVKAPQSLAAL
jgi:hypothetical protein